MRVLIILMLLAFPTQEMPPTSYSCRAYSADDALKGWKAHCKVTDAESKVIYDKDLVIARPATRKEAMKAIDTWIEKELPRIIKERDRK